MPTPPLTDEDILAAVAAVNEHGGESAAARAMGVSRNAVRNRMARAAERGLISRAPVMPGYVIKSVSSKDPDGTWIRQTKEPGEIFETPSGHRISGVSALTDAEGRVVQQWTKTRAEPDALDIVEAIKAAFADYEAPTRAQPPETADADLLTLVPLSDLHVGLYAWSGDAETNWDLSIAEDVIGRNVENLIERTPPSGRAIVLGGGDLLHSDNNENKTARSGNILNVDGRWPKVLMTACRIVVRTIDAALRRHRHVTVRLLAGNHDEHSSTAVAYFLLAWYRNEDRVTVDADPSLFFWFRFGKVMLGSTHGHMVKAKDMSSIMAHRRPEDWGATKHRFVHCFHLHHSAKTVTEGGGVITEVHQTPTPQDAWAFGSGFLSGRSMQAITYHSAFGEVSRSRVAIVEKEH